MIKVKKCKHGKRVNKICYLCSYSKANPGQDAYAYNDLYSNKIDNSSFELACLLSENINLWVKTYDNPEENYFREIENSGKLKFSMNTLRQTYYVIRDFKDVLESSNRKMSFSCYREIASSGITDEQKVEVRKIAETEKMTQREVRAYIKRVYKNQRIEIHKRIFDFSTLENALKEIEIFLKDHNVKEENEITVTIKANQKGGTDHEN